MEITENQDIFTDVVVLGGGLAGLSAACSMALRGRTVVLIEKKKYPRHKVCGEYVSNEVLPILEKFGFNPFDVGALAMRRMMLSAPSGTFVESKLPLGAFSLSRYTLDYELSERAKALGVDVRLGVQARKVQPLDDGYEVIAGKSTLRCKYVIGAFGKTSNLRTAGGPGTPSRSPFVGVKRHVELPFPDDLVALHNFKGGYCGVSRVEGNRVNICYLAQAADVHKAGGLAEFEEQVLHQNPHLLKALTEAKEVFPRPMAISNFTMGSGEPVQNGIFMAGDAAGMISPLCGNGMAMAITAGYVLGGQLAAGLAVRARPEALQKQYADYWNKQFKSRLAWGNRLQWLFGQPAIANAALGAARVMPSVVTSIIKKTHGEPLLA